jgi:hypothetical protein
MADKEDQVVHYNDCGTAVNRLLILAKFSEILRGLDLLATKYWLRT